MKFIAVNANLIVPITKCCNEVISHWMTIIAAAIYVNNSETIENFHLNVSMCMRKCCYLEYGANLYAILIVIIMMLSKNKDT